MSSWDGRPGPNENISLHLGLLALAGFVIWLLPAVAPLCLPLIGWVLARWVILFASWFRYRLRVSRWKPWSGRYYAFQGHQVRVHPAQGDIWIHADDVFYLLGQDPDSVSRRKLAVRLGEDRFVTVAEFGAHAFSAAAVIDYLSRQKDPDAHKLRLWLEREVIAPLHRRAERAGQSA